MGESECLKMYSEFKERFQNDRFGNVNNHFWLKLALEACRGGSGRVPERPGEVQAGRGKVGMFENQ